MKFLIGFKYGDTIVDWRILDGDTIEAALETYIVEEEISEDAELLASPLDLKEYVIEHKPVIKPVGGSTEPVSSQPVTIEGVLYNGEPVTLEVVSTG